MFLSLSRISWWWGKKSRAEEKITAVSYWRNHFYIPIPGGDYQLTILEQILTMGYEWCQCAAFLTALSVCVPPKNSGLTDGFFADFQVACGKHASVQCRVIRALLWCLHRTKSWFWCPAVMFRMTHGCFASSVDRWMGLDSSFDDHFNWVAMDSVAPISAPTISCLRISIHVSCPSALSWHLWHLDKDPGLGNLLGLKAEYLPQKSDLRLLMPYNLWLHKHFCFCGLGSSSQNEYSWRRGGRRQEVWRVLF